MSASDFKVDPVAALAVGALAVVAAGIAAAALLSASKVETSDELADRLVGETLRRGDDRRRWYDAALGREVATDVAADALVEGAAEAAGALFV